MSKLSKEELKRVSRLRKGLNDQIDKSKGELTIPYTAELLGVHQTTLWRFLRGDSVPKASLLDQIEQVLDWR